jgi:hypothetical protein
MQIFGQNLPGVALPYLDKPDPRLREHSQVTFAYLTLPSVFEERVLEDDECTGWGGDCVDVFDFVAVPVHPTSLTLTEDRKKRFELAKRLLGLEVFVHLFTLPSMMQPTNDSASSRKRTRLFNKEFGKLTMAQKAIERDALEKLRQGISPIYLANRTKLTWGFRSTGE